MEKSDLIKVSTGVQFNLKAEAQAIEDYSRFLEMVEQSDISEETKDGIFEIIEEIISDELNHQNKLHELYTEITEIKTNKN